MASTIFPSTDAFMYQLHHIILPPKLPQQDDFDALHEQELLKSVLSAMEQFKSYLDDSSTFQAAIDMVRTMIDCKSGGILNTESFGTALRNLGDGCSLGMHVRNQNFGLLVTRQGDIVQFEGFEVLAENTQVMQCKGRLRRSFPNTCIDLDLHQFQDAAFQTMLANLLDQLAFTTHASCRPKSSKEGKDQDEVRDTVDPKLLLLVSGLLRGLGRQGKCSQILKHSREEVLWSDARAPWHRSAGWLFLRVTLQLVLGREYKTGQSLFKEFMAFFTASMLHQGISILPNHLLQCVLAKVNRRHLKLLAVQDPKFKPFWWSYTSAAMQQAGEHLKETWTSIQKIDSRMIELAELQHLHFDSDADLRLCSLKPYLDSVRDSSRFLSSRAMGNSDIGSSFHRADPATLPHLSFGDQDAYLKLADFELWIAENLENWLALYGASDSTCQNLSRLIESYYSASVKAYAKNPVNISIMWLTIMELWVALDTSVVSAYPLLRAHKVGFPRDLLEPLTLPTKTQLLRLRKVEEYLIRREGEAEAHFPSPFEKFGSPHSFAARFYKTSSEHQKLHDQILKSAEQERAAKLQELDSLKRSYESLKSRHDATTHHEREVERYWGWETECMDDCIKCRLHRQMSNMRIDIHEWPLPMREHDASAAVFELQVPEQIAYWRQITLTLLIDMLNEQVPGKSSKKLYLVRGYRSLVQFVSGLNSCRLQLGSITKPFTVSHYRDLAVSEADASKVCQNHGCQYEYYDTQYMVLQSSLLGKSEIPQDCSFAHLSNFVIPQWIRGYGHSSNEVLAAQYMNPQHMTLDQFKAFGHLRSGVRIQWSNIVVQLVVPSMDLNNDETAFLLLQTCYHAGPNTDNASSIYRDAHTVLAQEEFGQSLLRGLRTALARFEENWESEMALLILSRLCTRLLSCAESNNIHEDCLYFLARIRSLSRRWVTLLLEKWSSSTADADRDDLNQRVLGMALVCNSTYDVGPAHFNDLFSNDEATIWFIEISIIIHDHYSLSGPPLTLVGLQIWRRISYEVQEIVSRRIHLSRTCLDQAVKTFWQAYTPDQAWSPVDSGGRAHVMTSKSSTDLPVSLNLLDGTLLVNGRPLSRLPFEYQSHATYSRLFGTQVLEVVPSDRLGMTFSAAWKQHNWTVHFALVRGELIIRALRDDSVWEFIPPSKLASDFPTTFVNSYSHWLNVDTGTIEFRPFERPWTSEGDVWKTVQRRNKLVLQKGIKQLIDPKSRTAKILAAIFKPIEHSHFVNIFLDTNSKSLEIQLCRYNLSFTIEADGRYEIRSKNYHGMTIDRDQTIQALTGLSSRLILCSLTSNDEKMIIVPRGDVSGSSREHGHPVISIHHAPSGEFLAVGYPMVIPRRKHDCFRVDTTLGRLVDNGSLQAKLFLCHLHAATSHCLPDQLTGRTGTEEALRILRSAAVASFVRLTEDDIKLLKDISDLSPRRHYYPEHMRVMQSIQWSAVYDPLAQNDEFFQIVQSLLSEGMTREIFFPDNEKVIEDVTGTERSLVERALIRSSTFRVCDFGAEHHTTQEDTDYKGRDDMKVPILARLERQVCQITKNLFNETPYALVHSSVVPQTLYGIMGEEVDGPTSQLSAITCRFDSTWLDKPSISIGRRWCKVQQYLSCVDLRDSKYDLMAFFSALSFAEEADLQVIQVLLAFTCAPTVRILQQPQFPIFKLGDGMASQTSRLKQCLQDNKSDFASSPEFRLQRRNREASHQYYNRRQQAWNHKVAKMAEAFISDLVQQGPVHVPIRPQGGEYTTYFNVRAAMVQICEYFASWSKNLQLDQHLHTVISMVEELNLDPVPVSSYVTSSRDIRRYRKPPIQRYIAVPGIFPQSAPKIKCKPPFGFHDWCKLDPKAEPGSHNCDTLSNRDTAAHAVNSFQTFLDSLQVLATSNHQREYVDELQSSFKSTNLEVEDKKVFPEPTVLKDCLEQNLQFCSRETEEFKMAIFDHLSKSGRTSMAVSSNCFLRFSPIFMLQQLNRHNWSGLPRAWQHCISQWALSLTHLQRAQRMLAATCNRNDLEKEINNTGHNWDIEKFPEWLILEIESGLMIRDVQVQIGTQMKDSPNNCCMQLNMGEGKSSVIVPIDASSLADGTKLVRIIVAKPQSKQMHHMLVTKLGDSMDRRIFNLPFSRSIKMSSAKAQQVQRILEECMQSGGVLLVQPEHLLSLKLMGIEYSSSARNNHHEIGAQLIRVQQFMDAHSRDIVDESDENFSVKFELIYTIGAQSPIEMSPDRWIVIQSVLSLVQQCAPSIKEADPDGIYLDTSGHVSQFPKLRILRKSAAQLLLHEVARRLCKNGLHGLAIGHQSPSTREAVFTYITEATLTVEMAAPIEQDQTGFFCDDTKSILLLLRGLFAGGVLAFTLGQKRWRVNFGLTSRNPPTLLAVPYRAKDSPALRAEFSHPDIVITLTSLSYYYGGLSRDQLDTCFEQVKRSDQADNEYALWANSSSALPQAFRQLSGINLKDRGQFLEYIFPALRLSKAVIDFFLATIVFPKEMVEFPKKLSASGWDLARRKSHPVTGFSGTCDSKNVLPLNIQQIDLPEQAHTNATVLKCLLRPENVVKTLDANVDSLSLLKAIVANSSSIDVLLDVGALIMDMSNLEVAQTWLELKIDKQAAIFVNDDDELCVIDRQGLIEPFLISPYASHTDGCLVFLDEAHTRGIDLRLPDHYRAATTLGPRLTKDRLAQACMRMRKLGKGQSVVYFVPDEIRQQIKEIQQQVKGSTSLIAHRPVTVADVLCWAISETWHETQRSIPLWVLQGLRYQRQEVIWDTANPDALSTLSSTQFDNYYEDEAMTLQQRYRPKSQRIRQIIEEKTMDPRLSARQTQIRLIEQKCEQNQVDSLVSANLQEEQERELAPETEQERQVEKPPRTVPWAHDLHQDVRKLVRCGILDTTGGAFLAAFESLHQISAAQLANTYEFGRELLVTADFARTVELTPNSCSDAFQRSVQWVLTLRSRSGGIPLVILSPWEANELLPEIEKSKHVYLHCYAPRPNISFPTIQDLKLFSCPSLPPGWTASRHAVMQLNLFAGELYFGSLHEYRELCAYLGLSYVPNDGLSNVTGDGFVGHAIYPQSQFTRSPTSFLRALMTIRRNQQDISKTHLGKMLIGEILTEEDFTV